MSRPRFFFNLGALTAAILLIVASVAFGPGALKGIGIGIGSGGCAISLSFVAVLVHHRRPKGHPELWLFGHGVGLWSTLAGMVASVTIWQIVGAAALNFSVNRWVTLGNGVAIAVLACVGLVAQEMCTERIIHVIEVVERPPRELA
jgi:peptidoglycan biosynthesis protein MviN/MurJ (putative lipid II flippase)